MAARHGTELHWGHVTFFFPSSAYVRSPRQTLSEGNLATLSFIGGGDWGLGFGIRIGADGRRSSCARDWKCGIGRSGKGRRMCFLTVGFTEAFIS